MSDDSARAPAVSVIVPTYQRRELVRRAVASVFSQTFRDFELIVVDDGSTDGTGEALDVVGRRLRYVWQENAGAAAARNAGLRLVRGRIVAFLDSDNRWLPDHLAATVRALDDHPEAVLAYSQSTLQPRPRERAGTGRLTEPMPRELVGNYVGFLSCTAVRREALVEVGGFDERLGIAEDTDLWLRLAARGGSFVRLPRRTLLARGGTKDSLITRRRRGEYVEALEASTERVIAEVERAGDDKAALRARGRWHFLRALAALGERDEGLVREELADACRLLPELSETPYAIVSHVRFNVAGAESRAERARQLATFARLWPDRTSEVARVLPAHAFVDAVAAARPALALRLSTEVSAGLAFSVFRSRLRRRVRQRLSGASAETIVWAVHQVMLRTGRGPLRPVWRLTHELLAHAVAAYLRGGDPRTSVYVCGSLAEGDAVFGLTDIDLVVVVEDRKDAEAARREVSRRWRSLGSRLPALRDQIFETPRVYGEAELDAAASRTTLTHEPRSGRVSPSSRERHREQGGAERPRLYGLTSGWRLLSGPDLRPPARPRDDGELRVAAWMELQFWWLQAFRACVEPAAPWAAYLCAKLLTEPARIWLWLARGERILSREALIRRAMVELPMEEESLRLARELLSSVTRSPEAPLGEALRSLTRMSARLASAVSPDPEIVGTARVRLLREDPERLVVRPSSLAAIGRAAGMHGPPVPLPLVDWRARAWSLPDECFTLVPGNVTDASLLSATALVCNHGTYGALRENGLIVLPSLRGARLRAVQCAASDPVSFALADGSEHAAFPDVPGWSVRDSAHRAAAEHLGWLRDDEGHDRDLEELGRLLSAARAALLFQSTEAGAPELPLDAASVTERLGDELAREAYDCYRAGHLAGEPPPADLVGAFRGAVERLPAYSEATS